MLNNCTFILPDNENLGPLVQGRVYFFADAQLHTVRDIFSMMFGLCFSCYCRGCCFVLLSRQDGLRNKNAIY